jgi:hypothetical protein
MGYPTITVEIQFQPDPFTLIPVYTDVTAYVRSIPSIRMGRQNVLTSIEAGEATIVLDNRDRRYDPTYIYSPHYPYVTPMRRVRIKAVWNSVTYYLFTGFVEEWPPAWEASNQNSEIAIRCVDGFKFFNLYTLTGIFGAEFSNYAVTTILNTTGWPSADRNVGAGQAFISSQTLTNKSALTHLQDIVTAEGGLFFIDGQGRATFQGRHYRLKTSTSTTSQGTFGDASGELPYQSLQPAYDDAQIWNDIHVTAEGGTEQISEDAESKGMYFKRTLVRSGLVLGDASPFGGNTPDNEAKGMADWLLSQYKDPTLRFDNITLEGGVSDSLWPHMLGRTISNRITVKRRPPPSGSTALSRECWIEAVEHRIPNITASYLRWQTKWQLSEATAHGWWLLDDTTYSVLDSTTVPAF